MKREAVLDYFIYNNKEYCTDNMEVFDNIHDQSIYEVIRLIEGAPLFLEDHLERLRKSANLLGCGVNKSNEEITSEIMKLVELNQCKNINVKLLCSNLKEECQQFLTYFIESHYPEQEVYQKGIHTILYNSERENPNAKIMNMGLREKVNKRIQEKNAYEALLVNKERYITEGSRSNMFFVKKNCVYTAPAGDVLLGVTRTRIMKVCRDLRIDVRERAIHESQIASLDGAFMTGTSVNVLPIRSIDEVVLNSVQDPIIHKITDGYMNEMKNYIENRNAR
ncbi:aminotransferase class IV [Clostridiaceae bacterium 35-E11]